MRTLGFGYSWKQTCRLKTPVTTSKQSVEFQDQSPRLQPTRRAIRHPFLGSSHHLSTYRAIRLPPCVRWASSSRSPEGSSPPSARLRPFVQCSCAHRMPRQNGVPSVQPNEHNPTLDIAPGRTGSSSPQKDSV